MQPMPANKFGVRTIGCVLRHEHTAAGIDDAATTYVALDEGDSNRTVAAMLEGTTPHGGRFGRQKH